MSETTSRKTRRILIGIYGSALLYFILKQLYYAVYVGGYPDQISHISYIIEMCRKPSPVPDFVNMPVFYVWRWEGLTEYMYQLEGAINYLGHPPLYYLLMSLTGSVRFLEDGGAAVDYLRICLVNSRPDRAALSLVSERRNTRPESDRRSLGSSDQDFSIALITPSSYSLTSFSSTGAM